MIGIWHPGGNCAPGAAVAPLFADALSLSAYLSVSNTTESITFVKPAAMTCMLLAALTCIRSGNADQPELANFAPNCSL